MRRVLSLVVTTGIVVGMVPGTAEAYPRPGRTTRVSPLAGANEQPASYGSPEISGDGRLVMLPTFAPLVAGDTNGMMDCYVVRRDTGDVILASATASGEPANGTCTGGDLSDDGTVFAWHSSATNVVPGDTNGFSDVFVRDLGAATTERVSVGPGGVQGDGNATSPSISDDGLAVSFASFATNLVAGDTNAVADYFVRDRAAGVTERVSASTDGVQNATVTLHHAISGNGRYVAFVSRSPWSGDTSPYEDVFVHDRVTKAIELISVTSDGSGSNGNSFYPSLSDDGRFVAFGTFGTNFAHSDFNGGADAFVRDRETGVTERVSLTSSGGEVNNVVGVPVISGNGRYVTANHLPTNYGYQDGNGNTDVYVYDRASDAVELASGVPDGTRTGNAISLSPSISDDGRTVAFQSQATDLLPEPQPAGQIYVREMGPPLGVGELAVSGTAATGWARFAGIEVVSAGDSPNDGASAAGAELTRLGVTVRPEEDDVLVRLELAPRTHHWAPLLGTTARKPGALTYGVTFELGGVRHELRAEQRLPLSGTALALHRCDPACAVVDEVAGGDGTAGDAIVWAVPRAMLGDHLGLQEAWVRAGGQETGGLRTLDAIPLAPAPLPSPSVTLGVAPAGTPADRVTFDVPATLDDGRFTAELGQVPEGSRVWARVCLGEACTTG